MIATAALGTSARHRLDQAAARRAADFLVKRQRNLQGPFQIRRQRALNRMQAPAHRTPSCRRCRARNSLPSFSVTTNGSVVHVLPVNRHHIGVARQNDAARHVRPDAAIKRMFRAVLVGHPVRPSRQDRSDSPRPSRSAARFVSRLTVGNDTRASRISRAAIGSFELQHEMPRRDFVIDRRSGFVIHGEDRRGDRLEVQILLGFATSRVGNRHRLQQRLAYTRDADPQRSPPADPIRRSDPDTSRRPL